MAGQSLEVEKFRYAGSDQTGITHSPGGTAFGRFAALYTHAKNFKACFGVCSRAHSAVVICPTCRCGGLSRYRVPMSLDPRKTSLLADWDE